MAIDKVWMGVIKASPKYDSRKTLIKDDSTVDLDDTDTNTTPEISVSDGKIDQAEAQALGYSEAAIAWLSRGDNEISFDDAQKQEATTNKIVDALGMEDIQISALLERVDPAQKDAVIAILKRIQLSSAYNENSVLDRDLIAQFVDACLPHLIATYPDLEPKVFKDNNFWLALNGKIKMIQRVNGRKSSGSISGARFTINDIPPDDDQRPEAESMLKKLSVFAEAGNIKVMQDALRALIRIDRRLENDSQVLQALFEGYNKAVGMAGDPEIASTYILLAKGILEKQVKFGDISESAEVYKNFNLQDSVLRLKAQVFSYQKVRAKNQSEGFEWVWEVKSQVTVDQLKSTIAQLESIARSMAVGSQEQAQARFLLGECYREKAALLLKESEKDSGKPSSITIVNPKTKKEVIVTLKEKEKEAVEAYLLSARYFRSAKKAYSELTSGDLQHYIDKAFEANTEIGKIAALFIPYAKDEKLGGAKRESYRLIIDAILGEIETGSTLADYEDEDAKRSGKAPSHDSKFIKEQYSTFKRNKASGRISNTGFELRKDEENIYDDPLVFDVNLVSSAETAVKALKGFDATKDPFKAILALLVEAKEKASSDPTTARTKYNGAQTEIQKLKSRRAPLVLTEKLIVAAEGKLTAYSGINKQAKADEVQALLNEARSLLSSDREQATRKYLTAIRLIKELEKPDSPTPEEPPASSDPFRQ